MNSDVRMGSSPILGTNINNLKFNKIMYKNKSIKILFSIDSSFIEILPTISIFPIEKKYSISLDNI